MEPNPQNPLPKPGERNILITSALPYVNNVPHLGNIIGSVLSADVFARYCRSSGYNTLFVGGTDEFGTTTILRAKEEGISPAELCDKYHAIHADVYKWFNISFDIFGRTTNSQHIKITHDIFRELWEQGLVKARAVDQLWCEKCEGFIFDRLVEGTCPECGYDKARGDQCGNCDSVFDAVQLISPRCKVDRWIPARRKSDHLFLDMKRLGPRVEMMFEEKGRAWSKNARKIARGVISKGLEDSSMCITRDGLDWGTPVPEWLEGFEGKVFYPWWDALLGYISITANGMAEGEWKRWWRPTKGSFEDSAGDIKSDDDAKHGAQETDIQLYQFLGADNIPFHTVLFPATLLSLEPPYTTVHHISATNYLTYHGGKFSKSLGTGVFGNNAQETGLSADIFRLYLLYSRPEVGTKNTEFTWDGLIAANNKILRTGLGSFIHRLLKMVGQTRFGSVVPVWRDLPYPTYVESFVADSNRLLAEYRVQLERVQLRAGLMTALALPFRANRLFFDYDLLNNPRWLSDVDHFPGEVVEDEDKIVVGLGVNVMYLLAGLLEPFVPDIAASMYKMLRAERPVTALDGVWTVDGKEYIKPGHQVGKYEEVLQVITGIKEEKVEEWTLKYRGKQKRQRDQPGTEEEGNKKKRRV
ncbi:putative cytoplasmic methionyl-tRNA synthetase [Triangularia verruculosa]|uniref:methionine--tRNA ligase n=1 Tax=Triangularia verruculosa TaxID=2587418 RepID=A0AAN6XAI5_9PEZI|nr:putative cytoplasmic methionyl-tRNA synthetase [Triangularia verruculosa]